MKNKDARFLQLIKSGDINSIVFAVITLLNISEERLLEFIKEHGVPVKEHTEENEDEYIGGYIMSIGSPHDSRKNWRYIRYINNKGQRTHIYCGHCISVFTHGIASDINVIDLTKEVKWT